MIYDCDCESSICESESFRSQSQHDAGCCSNNATVRIKIFGMWEYLCDRCFHTVNTNSIEKIINLNVGV